MSIAFTSNCGLNTYEAVYGPQFDPNSICANYLAGAGSSGSQSWTFTICGNSQFSIVVYGLEPGVTCGSYQLAVGGTSAIVFNGPFTKAPGQAVKGDEGGPFTRNDVTRKRLKRRNHAFDARKVLVPPPELALPPTKLLPVAGTPLAAAINGSLDSNDPTFTGPRHFRSGIPGDVNCFTEGFFGTRVYDQFFFMNDSPTAQRVYINFTSACGFNTYMAAYSPQFNPNSICANYLAGAGRSGDAIWEFTVCPNTQFSLVIYNVTPGVYCSGYSLQVFGNGIRFVGTQTDVAVVKAGPPSPVPANSDITYSITVSNNGPVTANNVVLTDALPPGTTFQSLMLLTSFGTTFPPPMCNTPPVGGTGTITCTIPTLPAVPGTGIPTSLQYALTLHVTPGAGATLSNTATVSFQGIDTNPSNNVSTASTAVTGGLDICLQDDANPSTVLLFSSQTGDYRFCCNGTVFTGRGTVIVRGSAITLQHNTTDRRVQANVDRSVFRGTASLQSPPGTIRCTISDRDTRNNTCTCP